MNFVTFATGSREGDARAPGRLSRILKSRRLPISVASAEQIHGSGVRIIPKLSKPQKSLGADALLTEHPGQPLAIFTADCIPVFLNADDGHVVGLLHAGWRGVQKRILPKAIHLLKSKWGIQPSHVQAWSGPHIGPCCFETQWDVARYFPLSRRRSGERWKVDLGKEIKRQAALLGVRWVSKKGFKGCTMHEARFYSYRRDKTPKRQVSIIMKRKTR